MLYYYLNNNSDRNEKKLRRNIFDLINDKEIDVEREFIRIHKLFEEYKFYGTYGALSICEYIDKYFFGNWEKRGRTISINDMFTSLNIRDRKGLRKNTIENLLLYIEVIINLISISDIGRITAKDNDYKEYKWHIYELLYENIEGLLEDLNYEIKELSNEQLVIVEKDKVLSAVAETNKNVADKVIEYRRFILKGKIKGKREILNLLANEIEGMKPNFKGTTYSTLMDDVQFMLNNLNIRHNNLNGKNKKQYVVDLSRSKLEKLYDQTFDMILVYLYLISISKIEMK